MDTPLSFHSQISDTKSHSRNRSTQAMLKFEEQTRKHNDGKAKVETLGSTEEKYLESNDLNLIIVEEKDDSDNKRIGLPLEECDIFTGEWVFDNGSHPLYKEECEFLTETVTCLKNEGRILYTRYGDGKAEV
ncbi:hypothetical protein CRYUN_Cryun09bG0111800 [Craigia yunnanensis]